MPISRKRRQSSDENVHSNKKNSQSTTTTRTTAREQSIETNQDNNTTYTQSKKNNTSNSLYQNAKAMFRRTAVPSRLVGRGQEREKMSQFYRDHVLSNRPGCLYISGMPGTGKTAMLTEVMRTMQDEVDNLKYKVNINTVNCMSIKEPKQIYVRLVEAWHVAVQPDVIQQAHDLMNSKKNVLNVVVLDEIDSLITRDQDVLYKIFEWASLPKSRLVLIGIANALDLTDRILPRLRAKNCEPQLLNFNPYSVPEISTIIKDRLYSLVDNKKDIPPPLFQPAAIELCSRKVAASMGDLRTALDVCRQAIELAEMEQKKVLADKNQKLVEPKVTIGHVMKVLNVVFGSPTVQKLKQLNLQQKIVLGVFAIMMKSSKQITLGKKQPV
ncbi:hypothetical protein G6F57_001545 [Rhizopus arrhizus]|uniref:AAA+ ATPase domain-containing protein n=1 Tax=Rhizopus oryzae TaxID=64495 RepID=A0A9P7BW07_RHIOR|nr:hypothetical protein G6F23_005539 [Rhizopus arrhizus]KAG1400973.1 hypothetical protein G6F58_010834 [Rhizopus delemar]KAG0764785.1 hypothetical protein G6F24_004939 [Rhizopus arrhizus]KAG0784099.1 hypothetical protein G6F22_008433 [Rhizopus arrhizus]KAG0785047.1 hypothetical protein G6F21_009512 [Rhizopus arrhizus]